jgi:hypothetical protein
VNGTLRDSHTGFTVYNGTNHVASLLYFIQTGMKKGKNSKIKFFDMVFACTGARAELP